MASLVLRMRRTEIDSGRTIQPQPPRDVGPAGLWLGTAVACAVSLIVFAVGPVVTSTIARRRIDRLRGYLSNPEHG
jgi:hypothetical protein